MNSELLKILRCPLTGQMLHLVENATSGDQVRSGMLISEDRKCRYPIRDFIPRFVPESNYADNFGLQWNKFRRTQLDSYSCHPISANRFWIATGWMPEELSGQWVLDVGCGAGRFAEIALEAGANLVALDYSSAVDACYSNLKHHPNLYLVQGDIYALPFAKNCFNYVYSIGVLQHTPNVANAFFSLPPMVAKGGRLCVDYYEKSFKNSLLPKYWLRPLTKRIPKTVLFENLEQLVPLMLLMSRSLGRIPIAGKLLKKLIPVANYEGILPLNEPQLLEWALLDTFDMLAPTYDQPQTASIVRKWLEQAGMQNVEVIKAGHLVGRGDYPVD